MRRPFVVLVWVCSFRCCWVVVVVRILLEIWFERVGVFGSRGGFVSWILIRLVAERPVFREGERRQRNRVHVRAVVDRPACNFLGCDLRAYRHDVSQSLANSRPRRRDDLRRIGPAASGECVLDRIVSTLGLRWRWQCRRKLWQIGLPSDWRDGNRRLSFLFYFLSFLFYFVGWLLGLCLGCA